MPPFMEFYNCITQPGTAELKERGSRFIAFAYPITNSEAFKKHLQALKKEHPKAVHHCFAYRLGIDGLEFRNSDDGEPSGTAGKPILGQLDSKGLTNTAIIVVRYFGGTLLGVPGLISAYKNVSSLVLQVVPIVQKPVLIHYSLSFDYTMLNPIMLVLKQLGCEILSQEIQLFCEMKIGIPASRQEELLYRVKEFRNVEVKKIL